MIVITAANGQLGRATAAALRRHVDPAEVRLGARNPAALADLQGQGFAMVHADYDDPVSLRRAFAGADAVLLVSGTDLDTAVRVRQHRAAIDAARAEGVGRLVYTSFVNPTAASRFAGAPTHAQTEAYLREVAPTATVLRNNQYAANLDGSIAQARETGVFALPGGSGQVAYVTRADIAAAAAAVLTGPGHVGRVYELTGPQALDAPAVAAVLSAAFGRTVTPVDAPYDDFRAAFRGFGLPEVAVEGLISLYHAAAAGEYAAVSHDVEWLTGRAATPLAEYVGALAAAA
jgi:NAD(P)H dehydrogenase (quinone)